MACASGCSLPRSSATALLALPGPPDALAILRRLRAAFGDRLTGYEVMARICIDVVVRHVPGSADPLPGHRWYALVQLDDSAADAALGEALVEVLGALQEEGHIDDAIIAQSDREAAAIWAIRENISEAQRPEGYSIKHDISVPVVAVPAFIAEANAAVVKLIPGARPVPFGHLGDGNIHYNVSQPIGAHAADFLARWHEVNAVVFAIVLRMGGSISAEHGIGVLKRDELPEVKDKVAIELMRGIKAMLDPQGIMNPGKVL